MYSFKNIFLEDCVFSLWSGNSLALWVKSFAEFLLIMGIM